VLETRISEAFRDSCPTQMRRGEKSSPTDVIDGI
jgi:hypothetical protein